MFAATPLLAPPYHQIELWWLTLPGPRPQQRHQLWQWLQQWAQERSLTLARAPGGVPSLAGRDGPLGLSLAYAGPAAVVAIGRKPLGIDLVQLDDVGDDSLLVAGQFLPASQCQQLSKLPPATRQQRFAHMWAQFEAALKAAGLSLGQAHQLPADCLQRGVNLIGLPPGFAGALNVSTPFSD